MRTVIEESERIQSQLWPTAMRSLQGRSLNVLDSLLFQSLNAVIDIHTTRLAAGRDRLPEVILLMLFAIAIVALTLTGLSLGLRSHRHV